MTDNKEELLYQIDYLKSILNELVSEGNLNNEEIIDISNQLDQLISRFMRLKEGT